MNSVDYENGVFAAINKVQDRFGGVAAPHLNIGLQGK